MKRGSLFTTGDNSGLGAGSSACGLAPFGAPGEIGSAGTASAAVAVSLAQATVEDRARVAAGMGRALAAALYVPLPTGGALPATDQARLDAGLYLVRSLGSGAYGSVCAAGLRRPRPGLVAVTSTDDRDSTLASSLPSLPLAVKVSSIALRDSPDAAVREVAITGMLSALVRARACPNLPYIYGAAAQYPSRHNNSLRAVSGSIDLFQEIADCDLAAWAAGPSRSEAEWMSVVFQVCAGLAWAARVYDLAHNDLYGRNILLSRIIAPLAPSLGRRPNAAVDPDVVGVDPSSAQAPAVPACAQRNLACDADPTFRYALQSRAHGWRRFAVRTRCWLARPADFGLASSDRLRVLGVDVAAHDEVARLYGAAPGGRGAAAAIQAPSALSAGSLVGAVGASQHAIFHPYLNAYARDMAVLLATVAYENRAPDSVRRWALRGLHALYAQILSGEPTRQQRPGRPTRAFVAAAARFQPARNDTFRHPDDLIDFVVGTLFTPQLLGAAGLPEDLFADDAATVAAAGTQFFALPLLDVPPPPPLSSQVGTTPAATLARQSPQSSIDAFARTFGVSA
jgi:hypothetical protein